MQFAYASSAINQHHWGCYEQRLLLIFFSNGKSDLQQSCGYSALHKFLLYTLESLISRKHIEIEKHYLLINITTEFHIFPRNNILVHSVPCEQFLRTQTFHRKMPEEPLNNTKIKYIINTIT